MILNLKPLAIFCIAAAALAISDAAHAKYQTLYKFCQDSNCSTGGNPLGSLHADEHGNLYGVAYYGGANAQGVAYVLRPQGATWTYEVIYDFCAKRQCADGAAPSTPLIADANGNLYGATQNGGPNGSGVFFKLSPPASGQGAWTQSVLYRFCAVANCADGRQPMYRLTYSGAAAGAAYDGHSPIYGIAISGGSDNSGVLYRLSPGQSEWTNTVLHSFCPLDDCPTGGGPSGGPVLASDGTLYGIATYGGKNKYGGVLYQFSDSTYQVIHNFCEQCIEGNEPHGALALDAAGNLYGTTRSGGGCSAECGTIFRFTPKRHRYTVLYEFCQVGRCRDGNQPDGDLLIDAAGIIYGTTQLDGKRCDGYRGSGTLYRLSESSFKRLHTFCPLDGFLPNPGLSFGKGGKLYGTTAAGGDQVIFQASP